MILVQHVFSNNHNLMIPLKSGIFMSIYHL